MDDGLKNRHANIHEQNLIHIVDNDFLTDFIPFSGSMKQIPKLWLMSECKNCVGNFIFLVQNFAKFQPENTRIFRGKNAQIRQISKTKKFPDCQIFLIKFQ
jgi:hypothetical protein